MKKSILMLGVLAMISFAACDKEDDQDYICTCKDSSGDIESTTTIEDTNRTNADDACEERESDLNDNPFSTEVYICTLN